AGPALAFRPREEQCTPQDQGRVAMMQVSMTRRIVWLMVAVTGLALAAWPAIAQQNADEPP
ncbi:MAG: hypothetical protein ACREKJ_07025, partial [Candidatus Rokuibacteriota bacterium]